MSAGASSAGAAAASISVVAGAASPPSGGASDAPPSAGAATSPPSAGASTAVSSTGAASPPAVSSANGFSGLPSSSVTVTPCAVVFGISTHFVSLSSLSRLSSWIGLNVISFSSLSVVVLFISTGSSFEMSNEPMSLTSVVESSPLDMKANSLNRLVMSSILAKSAVKSSKVAFPPSVSSDLPFVFVLYAQRPTLPSVFCGNRSTRQSSFSTTGAATRYFPASGIKIASIPGKFSLSDFWEFSSVKSKMKWSIGVMFIFPTISSYLAYSSSSFIMLS